MAKTNRFSDKHLKNVQRAMGAKFRKLRMEKGYKTVKAFADKHNLPSIQYWRLEKGKTNITLKSILKILAIYNIKLKDFFDEDIKF
ncbi:MAG: helix-turn-helix domain-containing protein [Bacteroidota bacterium]